MKEKDLTKLNYHELKKLCGDLRNQIKILKEDAIFQKETIKKQEREIENLKTSKYYRKNKEFIPHNSILYEKIRDEVLKRNEHL